MTWFLLAVAAAVINIVFAELFGWFPWIAARIIEAAARRLPADSRERYREDWLAELEVFPGGGISALMFAARILLRCRSVSREIVDAPQDARRRVRSDLAKASHRPRAPQRPKPAPRVLQWRRPAPTPNALWRRTFGGPLQWALENPGGQIVRPVTDFVLLCIAVVLALGGVHATVHVSSLRAPVLALPPLVIGLFYLLGLYRPRLRVLVLDGIVPALSGVSAAAMAVATLGLLFNDELPSQTDWLRAWLFSLLGVGFGRVVLSLAQSQARKRRLVGKAALIMGAGVVGAQIARRLDSRPEYGLVPIGFLDEDPRSVAEVGGRDVPVLGTIDDFEETVENTGVRHLIVAFSSAADAHVSHLIQRCQELGVKVSVVPRMFDTINDRVGYDTIGGLPLLSFNAVDLKGMQFAIKHALDRVLALVLLILFSPVILLAGIAVRFSSPGPALFRQRRVGRDGKEFDFYKFRSMRIQQPSPNDEQEVSAPDFLLGGDATPSGVEGEDRRTAVGRFLRSTSMDDLPQLFNVLRGDMSLVGPRPERPEFVELFRQDIIRYGDRYRVKSGITGWAQVHGLHTSLAERVELDNYYIAHWSPGLDLKILLLTLLTFVRNAD